nr:hypothetical protein [Pseudoalteromonas phenolica]
MIEVKGDKLNMHREQIARTKGLSNSDIFSSFSGIELTTYATKQAPLI